MPVYFVQEGDGGPIKIGFTTGDPMSRLASFKTGNSNTLTLLVTVPGYREEEAVLHRRFAALRVRPDGEWFRAKEPLLSYIAGAQDAARVIAAEVVSNLAGFTEDQMETMRGMVACERLCATAAAVAYATGGTACSSDADGHLPVGPFPQHVVDDCLFSVGLIERWLSAADNGDPFALGVMAGGQSVLMIANEQFVSVINRHARGLALAEDVPKSGRVPR